jgi:hypothetical protein
LSVKSNKEKVNLKAISFKKREKKKNEERKRKNAGVNFN